LVASSKSGKHTWAFVLPGPVCNLNIVGESPARESLPEPFGERPWNEMV